MRSYSSNVALHQAPVSEASLEQRVLDDAVANVHRRQFLLDPRQRLPDAHQGA